MNFRLKCNPASKNVFTISFILNTTELNTMSPNNGILFNGVLITKLLHNLFASCSFLNLDFLLTHFHNNIGLPVLDFNTFESTLSVSFLYCKP